LKTSVVNYDVHDTRPVIGELKDRIAVGIIGLVGESMRMNETLFYETKSLGACRRTS
jgi:hypothetical protein